MSGMFPLGLVCILYDYTGNCRSLGFQTQYVNQLVLRAGRRVLTGGWRRYWGNPMEPPAEGPPCLLCLGLVGLCGGFHLAPGAFVFCSQSRQLPHPWNEDGDSDFGSYKRGPL